MWQMIRTARQALRAVLLRLVRVCLRVRTALLWEGLLVLVRVVRRLVQGRGGRLVAGVLADRAALVVLVLLAGLRLLLALVALVVGLRTQILIIRAVLGRGIRPMFRLRLVRRRARLVVGMARLVVFMLGVLVAAAQVAAGIMRALAALAALAAITALAAAAAVRRLMVLRLVRVVRALPVLCWSLHIFKSSFYF